MRISHFGDEIYTWPGEKRCSTTQRGCLKFSNVTKVWLIRLVVSARCALGNGARLGGFSQISMCEENIWYEETAITVSGADP